MTFGRCVLVGLLLIIGCGEGATSPSTTDASSSTDATSATDATSGTDATSTSSSEAEADSTTTAADSSSGDTPFDLPCGDAIVCDGGDVCIEDAFEAECTNLDDPDATCPDGRSMTNCGGDGHPCCCLPAPASEFRCVAPTNCVGPADCECLGETLCTEGRQCLPLGADPEHLFRCESLPKP